MNIVGLLQKGPDNPLFLFRVVESTPEELGQIEIEDVAAIVVQQNGGHIVVLLSEEVIAESIETDGP